MVTLEQLKQITDQKDSILIPFVKPLNEMYAQNESVSKLNLAHFLAQICHESGRFRYTEELASGEAYDTRVDLGNTPEKDGDGAYFKGRGLIQLTGKSNYKKLSSHFNIDFVKNPSLLKTPEWAVKSAKWFWETNKLSELVNSDDFLMITYKINGGFNGLQDRLKYLKKTFKVLGIFEYEHIIDKILLQIKTNINALKVTRYRIMLAKVIPDLASYNKLTDFISKI